jgi:hypothetical protein
MIRRLYRPGVLETGLKVVAESLDGAAGAKKEAPASAAEPQDEYIRALAAKIVADSRYEVLAEKRKAKAEAEAVAKAEEPKLRASRTFAEAYHAWLAAKAETENPSVEDEHQAERFDLALPAAERRLMVTPSAYPDQLWQKLEAFESILGDEIMSGPRRDSVILLALASIKQDILNLELLEAVR